MTRNYKIKDHIMTQNQAIMDHLRAGRSLTPLDAFDRFGTLRLGARIYELNGHLPAGEYIRSELVTVRNREGEKKRVARYWLEGAF